MPIRGRHVSQVTATRGAVIGFLGMLICLARADVGWPVLVVGLVCVLLFIASVLILVRNHRTGRTSL